jgi:hypothetical protein
MAVVRNAHSPAVAVTTAGTNKAPLNMRRVGKGDSETECNVRLSKSYRPLPANYVM